MIENHTYKGKVIKRSFYSGKLKWAIFELDGKTRTKYPNNSTNIYYEDSLDMAKETIDSLNLEYKEESQKLVYTNKLVKEVQDDCRKYLEKMKNNEYKSLYTLIVTLENRKGKVEYSLNVVGDYLYLENIIVCKAKDITYCETKENIITCHLKYDRILNIEIERVNIQKSCISKIYVDGKLVFRKK